MWASIAAVVLLVWLPALAVWVGWRAHRVVFGPLPAVKAGKVRKWRKVRRLKRIRAVR